MGSEIELSPLLGGDVPIYFTIGTHFIHCEYRPF